MTGEIDLAKVQIETLTRENKSLQVDLHRKIGELESTQVQLRHLQERINDKSWGLLWEQGTAKTKPVIETAAFQFSNGTIDGLLVVAPPGVERNWNTDEIPKHLPAEFALDTMIGVFSTARKHTRNHIRMMNALLRFNGLS